MPASLILLFPPLFWAGNFVAGRMMGEQQIPITLSYWRWQIALLFLLPFVIRPMWQQRDLIMRNLPALFCLALLSVSGFNTLAYIGLQTTSATNGTLMNSLIPIYVLIISFVFYKLRPSGFQLLGLVLSFLGVLAIISKLDVDIVSTLEFTRGDLWILAATFVWGVYSVLLKQLRPEGLSGLGFLGITVLLGTPPLLGLYLWNPLNESPVELTQQFTMVILYVAIFPSLLAYLAWNYGLKVMGANIGSQFVHFTPVFGAVLASFILGEKIQSYHIVGALLIGAGLLLSLRSRNAG